MVRKSMKIKVWVWEPLGGTWRASWSQDGALERQKRASRGALMQLGAKMGQLGSKLGSQIHRKSSKVTIQRTFSLCDGFLMRFWKGLGGSRFGLGRFSVGFCLGFNKFWWFWARVLERGGR